jgi:hypothetical protein
MDKNESRMDVDMRRDGGWAVQDRQERVFAIVRSLVVRALRCA